MAGENTSRLVRRTLIIAGAIYAATGPLIAATIWISSHLGILNGIDKASTMEAVVDASLSVGWVILASLSICAWLLIATLSEDYFIPFAVTAWFAGHRPSALAYGPFSLHMTGGPLAFQAPQGFYTACLVVAAVLLIGMAVDVFSNMDDKDAHPFRAVLVLLWTLPFGLPIIGSTWRWLSSSYMNDLQVIPLEQVSAFGWLSAIVGAAIYSAGFLGFMSWLTKGEFWNKLKQQLE